ncbi:MAG: AI-2E family transporter [Deltaproteobacteria bacterium]|nr:AI-2E family transporter [Deltaproteobacteria bacterium]
MVCVAALFAALAAFRSLAAVLICFVILERSLGWLTGQVSRRAKLDKKRALLAVLLGLATLVAFGAFSLVRRALPLAQLVRENGARYLNDLSHHPSIEQLRQMAGLDHEPIGHLLRQHAGTALHYATGTAQIIMYLLVGFVLAMIYLFEREELERWTSQVTPSSLSGTLMRWFGYIADAIAVTVKMQAVVAVVSAVVTLPVLVFLGLPEVPSLFALLLVAGLVPIVGNVFAGAVLCYVAYTAKGLWAVGVFLGVTFVLHKIESYYLNPRLAAQHVKLPSIVLVISLLLFEQVFGFAGLFLSFPVLYVASRIANEWRTEDEGSRETVA